MARPVTRRLLAFALSAVVLDPLAPLAAAWTDKRPCRDRVCLCARHCPPQRSAAPSCHESAPENASARAACNHDGAAGLASIAPALLPTEASLPIESSFVPEDATTAQDTAPGFANVILPPPKRS